MFEGKPTVFDAFTSHEDEVTHIPQASLVLAGNEYTRIQVMASAVLRLRRGPCLCGHSFGAVATSALILWHEVRQRANCWVCVCVL